jgi:hypothetical protein
VGLRTAFYRTLVRRDGLTELSGNGSVTPRIISIPAVSIQQYNEATFAS